MPLTQHQGARQKHPTLSLLFIWCLAFLRENGGLLISPGIASISHQRVELAKQSNAALNLDWILSPDNTIIIINSCQDPVRSDWGHWHVGWALGDWGDRSWFSQDELMRTWFCRRTSWCVLHSFWRFHKRNVHTPTHRWGKDGRRRCRSRAGVGGYCAVLSTLLSLPSSYSGDTRGLCMGCAELGAAGGWRHLPSW